MSDVIDIQSENPIEQLWLYLSSLESIELSKKFISKRAGNRGISLDETILTEKAVGTAYCLRNAREYLRPPSMEWSKRILNTYYGLMSIVEAILIADPKTNYDLEKLEKATTLGHGLKNIDDKNDQFPKAQKIYVTSGGLFAEYLKYREVNTDSIKINRKITNASELSSSECVSIDELLARIPEISNLYFEMAGKMPLCVGISKDTHCSEEKKTGNSQPVNTDEGLEETWLRLFFPSSPTLEFIEELCIGLENYELYTRKTGKRPMYWVGRIKHKQNNAWETSIKLHKSPMASSYWIKPVMGSIEDYLSINYMLLYILSILVRYRPKIWREISEGHLDNYFAVIKYYIEAVSRGLPQIALQKVSGRKVTVYQPGTFAPDYFYLDD